jgi:hypothetical protein
MPQQIPLAKGDINDMSQRWGHMIQPSRNTLAGYLNERTPDIEGAAQVMNREGEGSRSQTLNHNKDILGLSRVRKSHPFGMRPSCRTILERALVGFQRSNQTRLTPTPPKSTSQVHPGHASLNPMGCTNERVWAYTCTSYLGL